MNKILASIPADLRSSLALTEVGLPEGKMLFDPDEEPTRVFFPSSGAIGFVVPLSNGGMVEVGMVGNDSVVGAGYALSGVTLSKAIVRIAGHGSYLPADRLRLIAENNSDLRRTLIEHEQLIMSQAQQSAACNAFHSVEAKLARWLLRTRDLAGDHIHLTQKKIAQALGVRRTTLHLSVKNFVDAGYLVVTRGKIQVANVAGLQTAACECYVAVKSQYELLFERVERTRLIA